MTLHGIMPTLRVDGFVAELIRHDDLFDECEDIGVMKRGYEFCITCTGSNLQYHRRGKTVFVVTQFTNRSHKPRIEGDPDSPIIILCADETLEYVEVDEATEEDNSPYVKITFTIFNTRRKTRRELTWNIHKAENVTMH